MANKKSTKKPKRAAAKRAVKKPAAKTARKAKPAPKPAARKPASAPRRPQAASKKPAQQKAAPKPEQPQAKTHHDQEWFSRMRSAQEQKWAGFAEMNRHWADLSRNWHQQMDAQMKQARPAMGGQTGMPPFSQRYADLFAQMGAPFLSLMGAAKAQAGATDAQDMQEIITQWLEAQRGFWELLLLQNLQQAGQPDPAAKWREMSEGMMHSAPEFWARFTSGMGRENPFEAFGRMTQPLDLWASLPGLGYTRERHEDLARLYRSWQAHEDALRHYSAEMVKIALLALSRFEETLKNPAAGQKPLSSLKDIYAHWVNISEDVYARFALSDEHAKIYGRMIDTLSQFRLELTRLQDQYAAQMNLPTRGELDTLHQRMHDMKRENRELRRMMAEWQEQTARGRKGGAA